MTREGLSSPFVALGAPKWRDMDYIYHAYVIFVHLNFCRHSNHIVHFWGNALANRAWGSQGRGEALPAMSSRGFLAVSLERVQHIRTCVVKAGGEITHTVMFVPSTEGCASGRLGVSGGSSQGGWHRDGGI